MLQKWRDSFIVEAAQAGITLDDARKLLRYTATLNRLAELSCSSEWADRDRVPCPASNKRGGPCLCEGYGSMDGRTHGDIPRIEVKEWNTRRRVEALISSRYPALGVRFSGDPRGCVVTILRPTDSRSDSASDGIGVPA